MRPDFALGIDQAQRQHLRGLVVELIDAYQSKQVSIDERHTPSTYARFLARLLNRVDELNGTTPMVVVPPVPQSSPLRASPSIKTELGIDELFGIPSLHNM